MKNTIRLYSKYLLFGALACFSMISCEEDDVFSGSPEGTGVNFTTLKGTISTTETEVVAGQLFPVTITLGDNPDTVEPDLLTFPFDVTVEAISFLPNLNKRARKTFTILAGQNSVESTMPAPSGDATTQFLNFDYDMQLYLSAIARAPNEDNIRGFDGKQYRIVSDTLDLGFGDSALGGVNSKRLAIRFDYLGPWPGRGTNVNDLNIVLKKNGSVMPATSSAQGVSSLPARPINGTLSNLGRYESINFIDAKQEIKLSNVTKQDSIDGIYTVKAPSSNQNSSDRPHNFKVGDEVSIENINGTLSAPIVVQVASVPDAYTFTFNRPGASLLNEPARYQPKFRTIAGQWSAFATYLANDKVTINTTDYYALKDIPLNLNGNTLPSQDPANWTSVKPKIDWDLVTNPPTWATGSTSSPRTYLVNEVYKFNNVVYVCIKQHTLTSGTPTPATDTARWTPAVAAYTTDVSAYTSTDTYTIEVYAKTIGGVSTGATPVDLPYKFTLRFPNETSKVYTGVLNGLTIGTAATAVPKLQIVKTTVQGVSSYVVSPL